MAEKKGTDLTREQRLALIERNSDELPLREQADLLGVSRSSLYYQPRPASAEEVQLKHRIDEIYTELPFYGTRKIAAQLEREGMSINRKTVGRSMQEMGIAAISPGPNLSKRNQKEGVYPSLLRTLSSAYPNHIWGIDITYIRVAWRLDVPRRDAGLVVALCPQLGGGSDLGDAFCLGNRPTSLTASGAGDLQQ